MNRPSMTEVLKTHTPGLMAIPGVIGTGEGEMDGAPCVLVLVRRRTAEIDRAVPSTLEGYPVRIDQVGDVRAREGP